MCDDGTGHHEMVPNPRRDQIRATLTRVEPDLEVLRTVLDPAERAMSAGAWTGRPADTFGESLSGRARRLAAAADHAREQILAELAAEPERVRRCETVGVLPGWPLPLGTVGGGG